MKLAILGIILASTLTAHAATGPITSGGGGAYVCREDGALRAAYMVDLWEAENTPFRWPHLAKAGKISIPMDYQRSAEEQFAAALARLAALDEDLAEQVRKEKDSLFSNANHLPEWISIGKPNDLQVDYHPTGCPPEGMMIYNGESEQLDIRPDIFGKLLSPTHTAAAWMHEALYKVKRETEGRYVENSRILRRLTACLFSSDERCLAPQPLGSYVDDPTLHKYECSSASVEFDLYLTKVSASQQDAYLVFKKTGQRRLHYPMAIRRQGGLHGQTIDWWLHTRVGYTMGLVDRGPFHGYDESGGSRPLSNLSADFRFDPGKHNNRFIDIPFFVDGIYSETVSSQKSYLASPEQGTCRRVRWAGGI